MIPGKTAARTSTGNGAVIRHADHAARLWGPHGRFLAQRFPAASSMPRRPWLHEPADIWHVLLPEAKPSLISGSISSRSRSLAIPPSPHTRAPPRPGRIIYGPREPELVVWVCVFLIVIIVQVIRSSHAHPPQTDKRAALKELPMRQIFEYLLRINWPLRTNVTEVVRIKKTKQPVIYIKSANCNNKLDTPW